MTGFVYRLDGASSLATISSKTLCARRWTTDSPLHPFLRAKHGGVSHNERIYRMCFWTSLEKANATRESDYTLFLDTVLLRCPEIALQGVGFQKTWDDATREGDAFMFWIVEQASTSNGNFSDAGVPFSTCEVLFERRWVALPSYISHALGQPGQ